MVKRFTCNTLDMSAIEYLDLDGSDKMIELPDRMSLLTNLTKLVLRKNVDIQFLPADIAMLPSLRDLHLGRKRVNISDADDVCVGFSLNMMQAAQALGRVV